MNRLAQGAMLDQIASYKWEISGPFCTLVIMRDESTPEAMWKVCTPSDLTMPLYSGSRCEGALSDAYSRVMGFTRM